MEFLVYIVYKHRLPLLAVLSKMRIPSTSLVNDGDELKQKKYRNKVCFAW